VAEAATPAAAYTIADGVAAAARAHGIDVLGPAPVRPPRSPAAGEARGRRSARAQCVLRIPSKAAHRGGAAAHESVAAVRAVLAEVPPPAGARIVVDVDPQELV
jgi:hypothetical protein